jgi:hypothetical protein
MSEQPESTDESIDVNETSPQPLQVNSTYKVLGELDADSGVGVLGQNNASSGTPIGVQGAVPSATGGYGLYTDDDAAVMGALDTTGEHDFTVGGTRVGHLSGKDGVYAGGIVLGHELNQGADVEGAVVAGGGSDSSPNIVHDRGGFVGGGNGNQAGNSDPQTYAYYAVVCGGTGNGASAFKSTVCGGGNNDATADYSTVGGGAGCTASGNSSTVGGGYSNLASGYRSTVAGGELNRATSNYSTASGGYNNDATGDRATVSGGGKNVASATGATIPGGHDNEANGEDSFAAGTNAKAADDNAFVWADGTTDSQLSPVTFSSSSGLGPTGPNTFSVRATGGARIVTGTNSEGSINAGVKANAGSGSWSSLSARAMKSDVSPVDPDEVLAGVESLPISTWQYDSQAGVDHMGPMAGEFAETFGLGSDEESIATVDADGVALAAIQGLSVRLDETREKLDERDERIEELERESEHKDERIEKLAAQNERIEDRLATLEAQVGSDAAPAPADD